MENTDREQNNQVYSLFKLCFLKSIMASKSVLKIVNAIIFAQTGYHLFQLSRKESLFSCMCLYTYSPTPYHQEEKRPAEMQGISQPHHQADNGILYHLLYFQAGYGGTLGNESRKCMGKPPIQETITFPNQLNISKSCPKAVSIIPSDHTLANENSSWTSLVQGDAIHMVILFLSLIHYNKLFTFSLTYICVSLMCFLHEMNACMFSTVHFIFSH